MLTVKFVSTMLNGLRTGTAETDWKAPLVASIQHGPLRARELRSLQWLAPKRADFRSCADQDDDFVRPAAYDMDCNLGSRLRQVGSDREAIRAGRSECLSYLHPGGALGNCNRTWLRVGPAPMPVPRGRTTGPKPHGHDRNDCSQQRRRTGAPAESVPSPPIPGGPSVGVLIDISLT